MNLHDMTVEQAFVNGICVGLFEGEGTINVQVMNRSNPDRKYVRLVVRMTDPEPIERLHQIWGGVTGGPHLSPSEQGKGYKPKYRWTLGRVDEALEVAAFMKPYVSSRRRAQLEIALGVVAPRVRQRMAAGNRRAGELPPLRARKRGKLVCPPVPEPSVRGCLRHKRLGIPVCEICRASFNLYYAARRRWYADKTREINQEQYAKNRDERLAKQRVYNAANRDAINARQRAYSARKRAERQAQTSIGSASPPSEMAPT